MKVTKNLKIITGVLLLFTVSLFVVGFFLFNQIEPLDAELAEHQAREKFFGKVYGEMQQHFQSESDWPEKIRVEDDTYEVNYTFNEKLEKYIRKLLLRYRSDFTSVVVIDNNSGDVLTLIDHQREGNEFGFKLSLANSHPAASIFKVVTAAELLENTEVNPDTEFMYKGRGTTLYKYQLEPYKNKRWTRNITFKRAFQFSNNVVFGKAVQMSTPENLYEMAEKFKFNQPILEHVPVGPSVFTMAKDDYNLAELGSGFNKKTFISPLHGALIASVIANDGIFIRPRFIRAVYDSDKSKIVWNLESETEEVISEATAQDISDMMTTTVYRGTARGSFARLNRWMRKNFVIGGKTGTITGGEPYGRRDWFVSFAKPIHHTNDLGISVCVMIVNRDKWYVRSAYLAKSILQYYYSELKRDEYVTLAQ